MGLTIHYQIKLRPEDRETGRIEPLHYVQRSRRHAQKLQRSGRVTSVGPIRQDAESLALQVAFNRGINSQGEWGWKPVFPEAGWVFLVECGEGCEPLRLGLCRYPPSVGYVGRRRWERLNAPENVVWRVEGFCKTQYANALGWEHFRRCHLAVIELVEFWQTFGAKVMIRDEGGYWPHASERALRRNLGEYDQCVAAMGGALKDADDSGKQISGPIFKHPRFESLEAQGQARHGPAVAAAAQLVKQLAASPH